MNWFGCGGMLTVCRWDKTTFDAAKKDREQMEKSFMPDARQMVTKERGSIREQGRAWMCGNSRLRVRKMSGRMLGRRWRLSRMLRFLGCGN
jgi:hypothetical protein